jgi:hypothetical protein
MNNYVVNLLQSLMFMPIEPSDHPKLDDSPLCDANQTCMFMSMISDVQWAVS